MPKVVIYIWSFVTLAIWPCLYVLPDVHPYNEKRILQVGLLLLAGILFICWNQHNTGASFNLGPDTGFSLKDSVIKRSAVARWGITAFLLLALISMWFNGHWYLGTLELSLYLLLVAFFLLAASFYVQESSAFNRAMFVLAGSFAGFYLIKFVIGYGMYGAGHYPLWPGKYTVSTLFGWANIRFFNQVQTWTLPLLVSLSVILKRKTRFGSKVAVGLTSFWWCLVFASGAQGSLIALVCAALLVWVLYRQQAAAWMKAAFISLVIGLALYFLLFYLQDGGGASVVDNSTKGRLVLWSLISKHILVHPLLGFGPLSLASVHNLPAMTHPHNSILRLMYEFGIPATLIVLGLVGWGMVRWLGWNRQTLNVSAGREEYVRIGLSVSLCAGIAHSLVSGVLIMPLSQLWLCMIAGWAMGMYIKHNWRSSDRDHHKKTNMAALFAMKAVVLAAVIFMSYVMITDIPRLTDYHTQYVKEYGSQYGVGYVPRFWAQGKQPANR